MSRFITFRLLLMVPSLLLLLLLAFILSYYTPGDAAESMLSLQGIQQDSRRAETEYNRNYVKLGLHLPLFYISIVPNYYPRTINSIVPRDERRRVSDLLQHKYSFDAIQSYEEARHAFIKYADSLSTDLTGYDFADKLTFDIHPDSLKNMLPAIQQLSHNSVEAAQLATALHTLLESKETFFYPVFHWHGTDNRFHHWITGLIRGDLGDSLRDGQAVAGKVGQALKWTLFMALVSMAVSLFIAIPAGLLSGYYAESVWDTLSHFFWTLLYAIPVFWLASICILYFTTERYGSLMDIFPLPGSWYIPSGESFASTVSRYAGQMVLPVLCLVANDLGHLSRIIRNNTRRIKTRPFLLSALASGQSDRIILFRHILPLVLTPVVTAIAGRLPSAIAGSLIVEVIFGIPGMGRLIYQGVTGADWPVVFAILLVSGLVSMTAMMMADVLYGIINPKIRSTFE